MRCTCAALLVLVPSFASAGNALDKPAFTATPAELLAEAKKAPPSDTGSVILRQDDELSVDAKGLAISRQRFVIVVTSKDGADGWGTMWHDWRAWQQNAPRFRARVIAPSGRVTELDPASVVDETNESGVGRHIRAKLPPLEIGSVIEQEVTLSDSAPYPGGRGLASFVANVDPTLEARISFSAPVSAKLHVVARALPPKTKPQHVVAGGNETWRYALDHIPPRNIDPQSPDDDYPYPVVLATTTPSWADAAKAYAAASSATIAQPPELPHGDTIEVARAVTAWAHHHATFDGVEHGEAAFDGIKLDAIVQRGSGNSDELAALLVALLRGAGIAADPVLVDRGPGRGADPDRPWIGAFDHVIVRARITGKDVWIDPEDPDVSVGQLHAEDQGRPALSISDGAFIHVPAAVAADNTIHEVRTFQLQQVGNARVTEVTREGGVFASDQRRWVRESSVADLRKALGNYVKHAYGGDLDTVSTTPADDLTRPLELTLTVTNSDHVVSRWHAIDLWFYPSDATTRLDQILRGDEVPTRKRDLVLMYPQVYEIENRIVVPEGFTMPATERDRSVPLGAFRLTQSRRVDGRTYVVTFRLEADKHVLTPAEVADTARAIHDLDAVHITLDNTAWALVDRGDVKKGLAEAERAIAAEPREGLHHSRLAQLLLRIGDGDGARREARKATEVSPKTAPTFSVLGFVLTHDLIGRHWGKGFDPAGARAALTKARALDPKYYGATFELAQVLERDDQGHRFAPGADLHGAVAAWRDVVEMDHSDEQRLSFARALLWSGDGAGAEAAARKLAASHDRDAMIAAAIAISRGADAATQSISNDRDAVLTKTAAMLFLLRQYDLARKLAADAAPDPNSKLPKGFYDNLKRYDAPFRPTQDPKDVGLEIVLEEVDRDRPITVAWDKQVAEDLRAEARNELPPMSDGVPMAVMTDVMRSLTNVTVEGDASAWRVELEGFGGVKGVAYLASDGKGPKLIGTPKYFRGVGRHVLRLAGKNDAAAIRLLDWMVKDNPKAGLSIIWGASSARDTQAVRLAGALLSYDPDRMLEVASKCLVTTTAAQAACDAAVAAAYQQKKRWSDLETFATTVWGPRHKQTAAPARAHALALMHLGRWEEAKQAVDDVLAKEPDDETALDWRARLYLRDGQNEDGLATWAKLGQLSRVSAGQLNEYAWQKVIGVDVPDPVAIAKRAAKLQPRSYPIQNTLAGVEAVTDQLLAATADLQKAADLQLDEVPHAADWFVLGVILENAGRRDDAIAAYRRVTKSEPDLFAGDSYTLATRHLKALGAKP